MSDLIDRQTAQRLFRKAISFKEHVGKMMWSSSEVKEWVAEFIEDLPSAEPRKKEKWIKFNNSCTIRCNQCGQEMTSLCDIQLPNYCPNCGCQMNGGEEE